MSGASIRDGGPEVVFRGVVPSDALLAIVREQDALMCGFLTRVPAPRRAVIRRENAGALIEVCASAELPGRQAEGRATHASVQEAIRRAYTELLRSLLNGDHALAA